MKKTYFIIFLFLFICFKTYTQNSSIKTDYLKEIKLELQKQWPKNHTINIVFHGHSVPAGYFKTPEVNTFGSYPFLFLKVLKNNYPFAVVNIINTSIGGEDSKSGAKRFSKEVLNHKPDVLFIDYALNELDIDTSLVKKNWENMIQSALKQNIKVILLTPTPDQRVNILEPGNKLETHSKLIRNLAMKHNIGLVDSYAIFIKIAQSGEHISDYMSQVNHPNEKGNMLVANEILKYFMDN